MASNPIGGASALPLALLAQAIPMLSRHELESLTERLIDRLDEITPDFDLEDDDPAGQCDEDGVNTGNRIVFVHEQRVDSPGCGISDPN
ncbi:hypothetical protein [Croceicoccus pelagius]|uniref:Uncharacterized protein n=1 Tax=Croceicoccus pelagius TaxID=1703341 RepID=A0A916YPG8_9SPHN|nr:hypothetical protein [Croceicoccus pelagius]GGD54389.1 hypothetical protein GCM10010989_30690 [Croceicoccus pelagius]